MSTEAPQPLVNQGLGGFALRIRKAPGVMPHLAKMALTWVQ
ncbi:Hypothetical protein DEACI_1627 [Acididesulfobacillus acetoxydans]|uniref:Uncharacterized protein n=1 Tax=Acididesulfobacillus acetoxydans TaxID=1561005 RepID=A0A8S0WN29_9FIRM|nr:Hypothetical protein DEACI_1627 [Acididesulfobacillus acetoxydans]CEJ07697.1 Hypothetical protein DEACI_2163 [Acididesulfobacillus acetoxydans]